jgi:hypothetical protein
MWRGPRFTDPHNDSTLPQPVNKSATVAGLCRRDWARFRPLFTVLDTDFRERHYFYVVG